MPNILDVQPSAKRLKKSPDAHDEEIIELKKVEIVQ